MNHDKEKPPIDLVVSFEQMQKRVAIIPQANFIWRGIIHPGFGIIFGPAKSGKTTFGETLVLNVGAGSNKLFDEPLKPPENRKVLIISLEEFYGNRTPRNQRQIQQLTDQYGLPHEWQENVFVASDAFPRYFFTEEHFQVLNNEIERIKPSIVLIDSLTRLSLDPLEESSNASKIMKRLRDIAYLHGITLIVIHHSQKLDNKPLTIASMAGSRVVGQEVDFMIGVNRIANTRYIKDVAYRYAADDAEQVLTFRINDNLLVEPIAYVNEAEIINAGNTNKVILNDDLVMDYFLSKPTEIIAVNTLVNEFVNTKAMSRQTLHSTLTRLVNKKLLVKTLRGAYQIQGIVN